MEKKLSQRFAASTAPRIDTQAYYDNALALLLEIEILLGLETPSDYQQQRMQYQVGRLSEQMLMASAEQHSNEEKALKKIQQWYLLAKPIEDKDNPMNAMIEERFMPIQTWLEQ